MVESLCVAIKIVGVLLANRKGGNQVSQHRGLARYVSFQNLESREKLKLVEVPHYCNISHWINRQQLIDKTIRVIA